VDPSGFQPSLIDSPGPGGIWQGPHPPSLPPPHHHPGRMPLMSPRELHFPYVIFLPLVFLHSLFQLDHNI
jgi:hypothetical protein